MEMSDGDLLANESLQTLQSHATTDLFKDIRQTTHDFVLIPSKGNFLKTFDNQTGLHIAIVTDHENEPIEFSQRGFCKCNSHESRWRQCLPLNFCQRLTETKQTTGGLLRLAWKSAWQDMVSQANDGRWTSSSYHCDRNNCFDFVLEFIEILTSQLSRHLEFSEIVPQYSNLNKLTFCETFVMPVTKQAAEVISKYRKANHNY